MNAPEADAPAVDGGGLTRRQALATAVAGGLAAGLWKARAAQAQAPPSPATGTAPAYRGANEVKPLPFDPSRLKGLSEKLVVSHHDNNYAGAVKRLNLIQQQLGALPVDAAPYQVGALKREELIATNSMILHELYFANLGAGGAASGAVVALGRASYGTWERWEREFRLTALSLAGGSGWVVLAYDPRAGGVRTTWASDHTQSLAAGRPLLVMDMFEHAYAIDYGADAKGYVDAFFRNVDWDEVNRRLAAAQKAPS